MLDVYVYEERNTIVVVVVRRLCGKSLLVVGRQSALDVPATPTYYQSPDVQTDLISITLCQIKYVGPRL
jgi:hypothetical protein